MNYIKQYIQDFVLHIELNRPEVLNAINLGMVDELNHAFKQAEDNATVRVILVSGVGEKSFSSGGDLIEFHAIQTESEALRMMERVAHLLHRISSSSKLTIAAINGYALGGGAELSTAFDLRLASDHAKIGFIQSSLGITTAWGGGTRLLNMLGKEIALPLLIAGEILSASEWMSLGYISKCFPQTSFLKDSFVFAKNLATKTPEIIKAYKQLSYNMDSDMYSRLISLEINTAAKLWVGEEHLRAANRFFQKNKQN